MTPLVFRRHRGATGASHASAWPEHVALSQAMGLAKADELAFGKAPMRPAMGEPAPTSHQVPRGPPRTWRDKRLLQQQMATVRGEEGTPHPPGQIVIHHDGTQSRALLSPDIPAGPVTQGSARYAYQGPLRFTQERLDEARDESGPRPTWIGGPNPTPHESMSSGWLVDGHGRTWSVDGFDDVHDWNPARPDTSPIGVHVRAPAEPVEGALGMQHANWRNQDCGGQIGLGGQILFEIHSHFVGQDARAHITTESYTERQKRAVAIYYNVGGASASWGQYPNVKNFHCTGTIVGPNVVLTAAHCFFNGTGGRLDPLASRWKVCTGGNEGSGRSWQACTSAHPTAAWAIPNSFVDGRPDVDFAMMYTATDLMPLVGGKMGLSNANPGVVASSRLMNNQFPVVTGYCDQNIRHPGNLDPSLNKVGLRHQSGSAFHVDTQYVKTLMATSEGASGSGIYRCPGGQDESQCSQNEPGQIVTVVSGNYRGSREDRWTGGASVSAQHTWLTNKLPLPGP